MTSKSKAPKSYRIYVASSCAQHPARCAWINETSGRSEVTQCDWHLDEHSAESNALQLALKKAPLNAALEIMTDSEVACAKLGKGYVVKDALLARILRPTRRPACSFNGFLIKDVRKIRKLIRKRRLKVSFTHTPADQNIARTWLDSLHKESEDDGPGEYGSEE
jgi:ribonuclease HI